eukprot:365517-Chlamydomonas_euryale.AAC.6
MISGMISSMIRYKRGWLHADGLASARLSSESDLLACWSPLASGCWTVDDPESSPGSQRHGWVGNWSGLTTRASSQLESLESLKL